MRKLSFIARVGAAVGMVLLFPALLSRTRAAGGEPIADRASLCKFLEASSAQVFEEKLAADTAYARQTLDRIDRLLAQDLAALLFPFFAEASRLRAHRIGAKAGPWTDQNVNGILTLAFVHPDRFFQGDAEFRKRVLAHLPEAIDRETPRALRVRLMQTIGKLPGTGFDELEAIALGWGVAVRSSATREMPFAAQTWHAIDDGRSPIRATLLSLPSRFFDAPDCLALLRAMSAHRPGRKLLVLTDYAATETPVAAAFREGASDIGAELIDSFGREFSPWLRDPMLPARSPENELVFLSRPNAQTGRAEDRFVVRQFVQRVSAGFEKHFAPLHWAATPTVFHGGHILFTPEAAWISIHSLQDRMLQILGQKTVDVARLRKEPAEWERFVSAAESAATELVQVCGRPVRFVHPWPGEPGVIPPFFDALSGGNDFDLDVLLTFVPGTENPVALVGDLNLGIETLAGAAPDELAAFARRFHIDREAAQLRETLVAYQRTARARGLAAFLSLVAEHFERKGQRVSRTPLLLVPTSLISGTAIFHEDRPPAHFPLGFSNAVIEAIVPGEPHAEAFSSGLPALDRRAVGVFAEAGCRLTLYPALVQSLIFEGGYRCATQEIRQGRPAGKP